MVLTVDVSEVRRVGAVMSKRMEAELTPPPCTIYSIFILEHIGEYVTTIKEDKLRCFPFSFPEALFDKKYLRFMRFIYKKKREGGGVTLDKNSFSFNLT